MVVVLVVVLVAVTAGKRMLCKIVCQQFLLGSRVQVDTELSKNESGSIYKITHRAFFANLLFDLDPKVQFARLFIKISSTVVASAHKLLILSLYGIQS